MEVFRLPLLLTELPEQGLSAAAKRTPSFRIKLFATKHLNTKFQEPKQLHTKFVLGSIVIVGEFFFVPTINANRQ